MPYGVAMDSKGNLWLSEEGGVDIYGFVIKMVQPDGTARVRAGAVGEDCFKNGSGPGASKFSQPRGLAVDASDNIYVADFGNCVIRKISAFTSAGNAQTISTYAGKNDSTFTGSCYQTFPGYANGTLKTAQFGGPTDIAIDKTTGAMYVADAVNNCIRKIYNGQVTTLAGIGPDSSGFRDGPAAKAKFSFPTGVFVAANGDVYVADHNNQCIRKISGGTVSTVVPFGATLVPDDVWVNATSDTIYFTSKYRVCRYTGSTLTTYAGSTDVNGYGDVDGVGTNAKFNWVKCLITDKSNTNMFYVADQANHKIKKVVNCATYKPAITRYGGKNVADTSSTCTGDTIFLQAPAGYASYSWSTGEKTQLISKKVTTSNITCTTVSNDGCQGVSDKYFVKISPLVPTITADGPTTFCPSDSVYIIGPGQYDWYKWTRNGTFYKEGKNAQGLYVSSKNLGKYILTGTVGACVGSSSEMTLATSSTIVPDYKTLQGSADLCDNDTLKLETNGTFATYQWKKNGTAYASTKSVNITTAGTYTLSVTSSGGCSGTSLPLTVTVKAALPKPTITITNQTTMTSSSTTNNQWYYNGAAIPNATNQTYTAITNGKYYVAVTAANGCVSKSDVKDIITSILELSNDLRFDIYPNPTTGKLNVNGNFKTQGDFNIRIVDLMGKAVYDKTESLNSGNFEKQIDLQGKASGIYFVIISSDGKQGMMKLILR
jgi:hypothetical protein